MASSSTSPSIKELNLYQKLLKITEEVGKIEKTGRNAMQNYAFIEQAQVVAALRPQLAKWGVLIVPETTHRNIERYDVTRSNGKTGVDIHVSVVSQYTIINADNPDERIVCQWDAGEAIDSSDKASNKATTASHKYFLMKLFNISDKDDADADSPEAAVATHIVKNASVRTASPKQIKWIEDTTARLFGLDNLEEIHNTIQNILTIPVDRIPLTKVKDAIDRITTVAELDKPKPKEDLDLTGIDVEKLDEKLNNKTLFDEIPF